MSTPCCCHVWVLIPGLKYKILTLTWAQEARVLLNKTHSLNLLQMYPHTQMCKVFISDTLPHEERPSIPSWQHDTNRAVLHFFFFWQNSLLLLMLSLYLCCTSALAFLFYGPSLYFSIFFEYLREYYCRPEALLTLHPPTGSEAILPCTASSSLLFLHLPSGYWAYSPTFI